MGGHSGRASPEPPVGLPKFDRGGRASVDGPSAAHEADACRPCIFEYHGVCDKGGDCNHCHFRHSARQLRRANPSQVKRKNVMRRLAARGLSSGASPPGAEDEAAGRPSAG